MNERLLGIKEVSARVGLSKGYIYVLVARGQFPRPVKIGRRAVRWPESVVEGWIKARIEEQRKSE
jgi:prophage regulatory protein